MSKHDTLDEYFYLNAKGIVTDRWSKSRVFVMSSAGWAGMKDELDAVFADQVSLILGRMGNSYGRELGKAIKKVGGDPNEAFGEVINVARTAGWGKMAVVGGEPFGPSSSISIEDCVFCAGAEHGRAASCDFLLGVLTGTVAETTGKPYGGKEKLCRARGDAFCQFDLEVKT